MATNVEIQKLFISVPKDLAEFFLAHTADAAIVDPKKIYFFEDGRIWTNGRTFSKSDAEFEAIFTGIDEKISAEEARALAAEQQLQANLDAEAAAIRQEMSDLSDQALALLNEGKAQLQAAIDAEVAARTADVDEEEARALAAEADLKAAIEQAVADAKSYSVAKVEGDELSNLGTTVKEAFKLVDEDGVKCGEYIKIYKDSAIKSVSYSGQKLIITYILADGQESVAEIDMAEMIIEAEHGDGLQVNEAGVVSVKRDETSEAFLSVSAEGIKVAGVQDAINTAVKAEETRALAAEKDLSDAINGVFAQAAAGLQQLTDALAAEESRAKLAEEANTAAIEAEEARAKGAEHQLQLNIENEAELRAQDIDKTNKIIAETKTEFNAELVSAVNSLNTKIQNEADTRFEQDQVLATNISNLGETLNAAKAELQGNIDAEAQARIAADEALEAKIGTTNEGHAQDIAEVKSLLNDEIARATGEEGRIEAELTQAISDEQARAEAKEAELAAAIKAEEERAIAVENTKVDWTYLGGERKAITLANHDLLLGTATNGGTYNIGMISKWDVVDLGTTSLPINLNTPAGVRPTVQEAGKSGEEAEKIAFLSDVDSANANLTAAIESEKARAEAAEKANADAIVAEAETARAAEAKLATDLNTEIARSQAAEGVLSQLISQEMTDRSNADKELRDALTVEQIRAEANERANAAAIEAETERAEGQEAAIRQEMAELSDQALALLNEGKAQLQAAIEAEAITARAAEKANADAIVAEAVNREGADIELQNAIDAEKVRAEAKEADLQAKLDQEAVNREGADIELQNAIDAEKARAEQAEADLQAALDEEIERAKAAEANNNSIAGQAVEMIIAEEARAKAAEEANAADIEAEATRATGEEARIEAKFDKGLADTAAKHTYSVIKLTDEELAGLSDAANVKEAFKLVDGDKLQAGETIKVYKDSALKSVALEDVIVEGEQDTQNLVFTYILADGTESVVKVDISQFVSEAEFKAGLQVIGGEVSVKIAEGSESFLSVDMNGVKLAGVQDAIDAAVAAEQARAEAKEAELNEFASGINTKLNMKVTELNTAIADEKSRAEGEEQRIEAKLDAEIARSIAKDDDLFANIGSLNNTLFVKAAELQGNIDTEIANREAAVTAEKERAEAAEAGLQSAIDTEKARAEQAEANEAQARQNADDALQSTLDAEIARATAAEQANAGAIADEAARAKAAEKANADAIAALTTSAAEALAAAKAELQQAIQDETDARIADVDAEEERAKAAEQANADAIAAEAQTARDAEQANADAIAAEKARAIAKEGDLSDAIQNTFNQAAAGLQALQTALNDEAAARTNADNKLTNDLIAESDRAKAQEDKIEASIGLAADGSHVTARTNYTGTATTIAGEIALLDAQVKLNADNITTEIAERKAADAKEIEDRQKADADILTALHSHAEEFNQLIAAEDNEVRAYAEELVSGAKLKAEQDLTAHATATTGKVSLADRTRQLITVALAEKAGKIDDTTNDTYVDVVYSQHNSSASTVSDGIVTGDVLVSVLDNLWETFATA